jgi:hypothetical protein
MLKCSLERKTPLLFVAEKMTSRLAHVCRMRRENGATRAAVQPLPAATFSRSCGALFDGEARMYAVERTVARFIPASSRCRINSAAVISLQAGVGPPAVPMPGNQR